MNSKSVSTMFNVTFDDLNKKNAITMCHSSEV